MKLKHLAFILCCCANSLFWGCGGEEIDFSGELATNVITQADEVTPVGQDTWKSLTVNITQLDPRSLMTDDEPIIRISFGYRKTVVYTEKLSSGQPVQRTLTIPARSSGNYAITYEPGDYYTGVIEIKSGNIKNGRCVEQINLKRIDVNHMVVTREDGSVYSAKGEAYLKYVNSHGESDYLDVFPTGNGLDVPSGFVYEVEVSAETEDGTDRYKTTLDFTH